MPRELVEDLVQDSVRLQVVVTKVLMLELVALFLEGSKVVKTHYTFVSLSLVSKKIASTTVKALNNSTWASLLTTLKRETWTLARSSR